MKPEAPPDGLTAAAKLIWWQTLQQLRELDTLHLVSPPELVAYCQAVVAVPRLGPLRARAYRAQAAVVQLQDQGGGPEAQVCAAIRRMNRADKAHEKAREAVKDAVFYFFANYGVNPPSWVRLGGFALGRHTMGGGQKGKKRRK